MAPGTGPPVNVAGSDTTGCGVGLDDWAYTISGEIHTPMDKTPMSISRMYQVNLIIITHFNGTSMGIKIMSTSPN